jgi:hypothetical protein
MASIHQPLQLFLAIKQLMNANTLDHLPDSHVTLWTLWTIQDTCVRQLHFHKHVSVFHVFLKLLSKLQNISWCPLTLFHSTVKYNLCLHLLWRNWANWNFLFTNHWWSQHEQGGYNWLKCQTTQKGQPWNFCWLHIILLHMKTSTSEQHHPKQRARN